jgi:hypothetical protein
MRGCPGVVAEVSSWSASLASRRGKSWVWLCVRGSRQGTTISCKNRLTVGVVSLFLVRGVVGFVERCFLEQAWSFAARISPPWGRGAGVASWRLVQRSFLSSASLGDVAGGHVTRRMLLCMSSEGCLFCWSRSESSWVCGRLGVCCLRAVPLLGRRSRHSVYLDLRLLRLWRSCVHRR